MDALTPRFRVGADRLARAWSFHNGTFGPWLGWDEGMLGASAVALAVVRLAVVTANLRVRQAGPDTSQDVVDWAVQQIAATVQGMRFVRAS